MGLMTISGIDVKSVCRPWGNSMPGDMMAGELANGEFMSLLLEEGPLGLLESELISSNRGTLNLFS